MGFGPGAGGAAAGGDTFTVNGATVTFGPGPMPAGAGGFGLGMPMGAAAGAGPAGAFGQPIVVPHLLTTMLAYLQRLQSPDFNPGPVQLSSLMPVSGAHRRSSLLLLLLLPPLSRLSQLAPVHV